MKNIELWYGALLHDIGKIVYRSKNDYQSGKHSFLGGEYLKNFLSLKDKQGIEESIKYHHYTEIKNSTLKNDSLAYITYIADNIASGIDRKELENSSPHFNFDQKATLQSVFNTLNGNNQTYDYPFATNEFLNFPSPIKQIVTPSDYSQVLDQMTSFSNVIKFNKEYFNSLLQWTESYWSYIPSSTDRNQLMDISLFDHSKVTCNVATCIYEYLKSNQISDYKNELFTNAKSFYDKDVFLLVSLDMSGIQDFIYNISGEKALKSLRARSFYLEMMLEHIIDTLLDTVNVSRANLLYTGGGHAYILLANTKEVINALDLFETKIKEWFLDNFKTDLYLAIGHTSCSGNSLKNYKQDDSYKQIWLEANQNLTQKNRIDTQLQIFINLINQKRYMIVNVKNA